MLPPLIAAAAEIVAASALAAAAEIEWLRAGFARPLRDRCNLCMAFVVVRSNCTPFAWPLSSVLGFCCSAFAWPLHGLWNLCPGVAPPLQGLCHDIARDAHPSGWLEKITHTHQPSACASRCAQGPASPPSVCPCPFHPLKTTGRGAGGARRRRDCRAGLSRE